MFEIFNTMAIPIINNAAMQNTIASKTLNVPATCSSTLTIFLSARGSAIAAEKLYSAINTVSLIIGIAHIPITTIIPTIPTAFFITEVAPKYSINRIAKHFSYHRNKCTTCSF